MIYTPPRFQARSVNRFTPVIEAFLRNGGTPVSFDPTTLGLSLETAMARLRDAISALSTGLVKHPSINAEVLRQTWQTFKVTSDGTNVVISPRLAEQGPTATPVSVGRAEPLAVLQVDASRFVETLTAFAVLLGQRLLQGEVTIKGNLPSTLQTQLESENDIVFRKEDNNTYIMF